MILIAAVFSTGVRIGVMIHRLALLDCDLVFVREAAQEARDP
jgi:hypothetical protein